MQIAAVLTTTTIIYFSYMVKISAILVAPSMGYERLQISTIM